MEQSKKVKIPKGNFWELINPKKDLVFKKLFEDNIILQHFIQTVVGNDIGEFKIIERPNTESIISVHTKTVFYDVLCKEKGGMYVIVEMQRWRDTNIQGRFQYYASHNLIKQLERGGNYDDLRAIYIIAIYDYLIEEKSKDLLIKYPGENYHYLTQYYCLQLPNYEEESTETNDLYNWARLLSCIDGKNYVKKQDLPEIIVKAYTKILKENFSEEELKAIERDEKFVSPLIRATDQLKKENKDLKQKFEKAISKLVKSTDSYEEYICEHGSDDDLYISEGEYYDIKSKI